MTAKMKRRHFITLLGGAAAAWPLAARAQQGERVRRLGSLMPFAQDNPVGQARMSAFLQGLQQLGWVDGRNLASTHAGAVAKLILSAHMPGNWSRASRKSSWLLPAPQWPPYGR
jgi:hypothetical protein